MEKKSETEFRMVRGTEHVHGYLKRAQHLIDFIDKEAVMRSLLHRVHEAEKAEGITIWSKTCFWDCTGLDYCNWENHPDVGWFIGHTEDKPGGVFNEVLIGETLDIVKIISALNLNAHDIAELIAEARERDERLG